MIKKFSKWERWEERHSIPNLFLPGIYAIAYSDQDISGKAFSWRPEIIYFGMTNSRGGLRSRLRQFKNTIMGKRGHGGAHRVRYKYPKYLKLVRKLFVSVYSYKCNVQSNAPSDLLIMGAVAKHEYVCLARFVERFGRLPEFNDKKRSPKK